MGERDEQLQLLKADADLAKEQVNELNVAISQQKEELLQMQERIGKSDADVNDAVSAAKAELDSVVARLEQELQQAKENYRAADIEKQRAQADLANVERQLASTRSELEALRVQVEQVT